MAISVIDPIGRAWERMLLVCFRPFNIGKWFVLGFCAWLAYLGEWGASFNVPDFSGGGGGGRRGGGGIGRGGRPAPLADPFAWISANMGLVILGVAVIVILIIAVVLVLMWLRSRGKFMFLDGVAYNRALVVQPWHEYRRQGNSLFIFNVILWILSIVGFVLIAGVGLLIAWPDINRQNFGSSAITALIVFILLIIIYAVAMGIISVIVEAFLVPLMYLRHTTIGLAWQEFRSALLPGNFWNFVLFFLMLIVFGIAGVLAAIAFVIVTCCIGYCLLILPYIWAVVSLPLLVFMRSYSVYFLEQFGPNYQVMQFEPVRPTGFPVEFGGPPPMPPGV